MADPAIFLVSNSVLGIFFSLCEQLVYSVMERESQSLYYCLSDIVNIKISEFELLLPNHIVPL